MLANRVGLAAICGVAAAAAASHPASRTPPPHTQPRLPRQRLAKAGSARWRRRRRRRHLFGWPAAASKPAAAFSQIRERQQTRYLVLSVTVPT